MLLQHFNGCCAATEITGLRDHKSGEEAMRAFTHQLWGRNTWVKDTMPGAFYIFTGVWKYNAGAFVAAQPTYLQNFLAYIKENKLGAVTGSVIRSNRAVHPEHMDRIFVWAPDHPNLRKWWEADKKAQKAVRAVLAAEKAAKAAKAEKELSSAPA